MVRVKKPRKPTLYESRILAQIAQSPLTRTYTPDNIVVWQLQNGRLIPPECANALVRNGWVVSQHGEIGLFNETKVYTALKPKREY